MAFPRVEARVPPELHAMVHDRCERFNITPTDVIRDALTQYFYNQTTLQGVDAGFQSAKNLAPRLAKAMLMVGLQEMPDDITEAQSWADRILGSGLF